MKIAFIGLGNMGAPMARNLIAAGQDVAGYDATLTPEGITCAASAADAANGAEVIILMLPNGRIVQSVVSEIIDGLAQGAVVVDCSTIDVESARMVAQDLAARGLGCVDAPVSGGIGGAQAGTLTFMAGGDTDTFAAVKPLFDIMGSRAVHCGPAGNGQAAKICNNMILGATMAVTCEAIALADKLGLGRQEMFDVVSTSSGYSWSMNAYCPAPGIGPASPADNAYTPGFSATLMLKDLRLGQQAAQAANSPTPIAAAATSLYADMVEIEGMGGMDFSALLPLFESKDRES